MINQSVIRKIRGDILSRKGRTALVAISIFIGVLGVVTLVTASDLLVTQMNKDIDTDKLPMAQMIVSAFSDTVDNDATLATLRQQPGVTTVEGQANLPLFWKAADEARFISGFLYGFSEPFENIQLQPPSLIEGRYPTVGSHEIAIEARMAKEYDLAVGDQVDFRVLSSGGELTEQWTITGMIYHPYLQDTFKKTMYANLEDVRYITGSGNFNFITVRYTDFATAEASLADFGVTMRQETPYVPLISFTDDPDNSALISSIKQITDLLSALGVIAMSVAGFLVINVINNLVAEQKRQIGVLKSLGATRLTTFKIYGGIVMTYGLIGMLPGVLLGIPAGYKMAQLIGDFSGTLINEFAISPVGIGLGIVLGMGVPMLAAVIPVYNGTRITILDAMTDLGISGGYQAGMIAKFIAALPLPASIKQSLNNINQKKGRLVLTVFTLVLAVTAFMGVTAVFISLKASIDRVANTFNYQIQVNPSSQQDFETVRNVILENVAGVKAVYPGTGMSAQVEGFISPLTNDSQLIIVGFDTTTDVMDIEVEEGRAWSDDPTRNGIVITRGTANQLDLEVGDPMNLVLGGNPATLEVIGIASLPFDMAFMRWQNISEAAGLVENSAPTPNVFMVVIQDDEATAQAVDVIMEDMNEALASHGITVTMENQVASMQMLSEGIVSLGVILNLASLVMAAVGAIGLLTTLSIAVLERQKEIGVMRSVGASSWVIILQFLVEGLFIGVLAWVVAVPLSVGLAYGVNALLPFKDLVSFSYPPILIVFGLAGVLVITAVSSIYPSTVAARKTVSEILRYQ